MDVTVLYYPEENTTQITSEQIVCTRMRNGARGQQPAFDPEFRKGKIIVAVLEGHVNMINSIGDEFSAEPDTEALDIDCPVHDLTQAT